MNDDSLSDVVHRYGFGDLYDEATKKPNSVGISEIEKIASNSQLCRDVWNAAIEAAANVANAKNGEASLTSIKIRRLKK